MFQNDKKLFATILALTFSLSCVINIPTFASEDESLYGSQSDRINFYSDECYRSPHGFELGGRPFGGLSASAPARLTDLADLDDIYKKLVSACDELASAFNGLVSAFGELNEQSPQSLSGSMSEKLYDTCQSAMDPENMKHLSEDPIEFKKQELAIVLTYLYDIAYDYNSWYAREGIDGVDRIDPGEMEKIRKIVVKAANILWEIDLDENQSNPFLSKVDEGCISYFDALSNIARFIWNYRVHGTYNQDSLYYFTNNLEFLRDNGVLKIFKPILDDSFEIFPFYKYYNDMMKEILGMDLKTYIDSSTESQNLKNPEHCDGASSYKNSFAEFGSTIFDGATNPVGAWDYPDFSASMGLN